MDPEQAALAGELLRAERLVPMHFDGYDVPDIYEPVADAAERLTAASPRASVIELGASIEV
jgi:L-ascorbate metabolism protein UlaG (beta-lactamase superfamily)